MDINEMTDYLLQVLEEGKERFLTSEKPETDRAFFQMVKANADPVFNLLDKWADGMYERIQKGNSELHQPQIDATKDNMESFVLHSFYKDTRKRRFMEIYKSCHYIFIQCKKELA